MNLKSALTTIHAYKQWCRDNAYLQIANLPPAEYEVVDNWRFAVVANSDNDIELATPSRVLSRIIQLENLFGPEILDDIQRSYDEI